MIIHSKDYLTNVDEKSVQPNAVDIRAFQLLVFDSHDTVLISESQPKMFASRQPAMIQQDGHTGVMAWIIPPQSIVEVLTNHNVNVPEGMAGFIQIRSTLARNGLICTNGIFDAGYNGVVGSVLHNPGPRAVMLEVGCRYAQFYMVKAETSHLYDGYYNQPQITDQGSAE